MQVTQARQTPEEGEAEGGIIQAGTQAQAAQALS